MCLSSELTSHWQPDPDIQADTIGGFVSIGDTQYLFISPFKCKQLNDDAQYLHLSIHQSCKTVQCYYFISQNNFIRCFSVATIWLPVVKSVWER